MGEILYLTADDKKTLDDLLAWKRGQAHDPGRTFMDMPLPRGCVPVCNAAVAECPEGGLLWVSEGWDDEKVLHKGIQPIHPGWSRLVIAAAAIPVSGNGAGYNDTRPHKILLDDWADVEEGDAVGCGFDTFKAIKFEGGPFRILTKMDTPYAMACRTLDRLDNKMCKLTANTGRPFKVIVYSGHTVTQDSPGNVTPSTQ